MKSTKISLAALFFLGSFYVHAQEAKKDTLKQKESNIEGVQLKGSNNKKTETAVLVEQKKSIIQKQAMSSEEISRKGISNVEQGLTKITGINIVEGRGLFVRGLEERYNTLLINGLASPSNNPFQKIIALKHFPTDVVGKLNIYKTFSTNLYADFAGATFDVETLSLDKPFSKVEFSVGVNTQSTFRDFKISKSANTMEGFIGLNSRDRQLPAEVNGYRPNSYIFTQGQSINSFKDSWDVDQIKSLPNTSIGFTTAQKLKIGETTDLGVMFSLNQGSSYHYQHGNKNNFNEVGQYRNNLKKTEYTYETESSALLGFAVKKRNTLVELKGIFLQTNANIIDDYFGTRDNGNTGLQFFRVNQQDISRFTDLQVSLAQKIGERHQFKASASMVNNNYQQPDRKIFYGAPTNNPDVIALSYGQNNLIRQYLDIKGKNYFSAFAEYTLGLGEKLENNSYPFSVTIGYNGFADKRNSSYRFIYARLQNPLLSNVNVNIDNPQKTFNNSILNGAYVYNEGSTSVYKTNLYQFVNAGYAQVNYKPNENWDVTAGARVENNINITRYKILSDNVNDPFRNITKNQYYILPSLSVKNSINSKSNLRFAGSKTLTRPILIEYFPIEYINPDNENILGNYDIYNSTFDQSGLLNSENYNFDLKYELFPTNKEMFAINAFAKRIEKAIERTYTASANSNGTIITFYNAKKADIIGVELEGILSLGRISENLNKFTLGANATVMMTNVERSALQEKETDNMANRKRGLQGAAPYTFNADLKYETNNKSNFKRTMSLVYNVSGKKIYAVGFGGLDNVYEQPFHQLDFIYSNQINKNWNYKLAIQNILNSEYKLDLGERNLIKIQEPTLRMMDYRRGTNFNLTVGYTF